MGAWKPEGYTSVSPYIIVQGAQQVIDFLVATLDAEPLRRFDAPDGRIMHSEVRIDDTVVMIADASPDWQATPIHVHVYVPDVDASFARAVAAGGTVVQEPKQGEDPDRRGGITDPAGVTWWLSTQQGA